MAAFAYGVRRVVTGLVKLLLIADVLGAAADRIFAPPVVKTTADAAWFAAACFALEVYFRFSGYADIAIGLGRTRVQISRELPAAVHRRFPARVLAPLERDADHVAARLPVAANRRTGSADATALCEHRARLLPGRALAPRRLERDRVRHLFWNPACDRGRRFPRRDSEVAAALRHVYVLTIVTVGWMLLRADSPGAALSFASVMAGATGAAGSTVGVYLTPDDVAGADAGVHRRRAARPLDQPLARLSRRRHDVAADDAGRDGSVYLATGGSSDTSN